MSWNKSAYLADFILSYLHSQGGVLKVNRDLPEIPEYMMDNDGVFHLVRTIDYESNLCHIIQQDMLTAGYVAVEPLIEEKNDKKV